MSGTVAESYLPTIYGEFYTAGVDVATVLVPIGFGFILLMLFIRGIKRSIKG